MNTIKTMTAAAALLTFAGTAHADLHTTGNYGAWTTLAGTAIGDNSTHMCVAAVSGTDRGFAVKYYAETKHLTLELHKQAWNLPKGQEVSFTLQVDHAPVMTFTGTGSVDGIRWGMVAAAVDRDETYAWPDKGDVPLPGALIQLLMEGKQVSFYFDAGNERPWEASLDGSAAALFSFTKCIMATQQATQPFAAAPTTQATQPFAAAPTTQATQPFAAAPTTQATQPFAAAPTTTQAQPVANPWK